MHSNLDARSANFNVLNVEAVSHSLDIPEGFEYDKSIHKLDGSTQIRVEVDIEKNILIVFVEIHMNCSIRSTGEEIGKLFYLKSRSRFFVEKLTEYISDKEELDVEINLLSELVQISMDHTRGMQSVYLKGSPLGKITMPRKDVAKLLQK